jgi:hypothetical protein
MSKFSCGDRVRINNTKSKYFARKGEIVKTNRDDYIIRLNGETRDMIFFERELDIVENTDPPEMILTKGAQVSMTVTGEVIEKGAPWGSGLSTIRLDGKFGGITLHVDESLLTVTKNAEPKVGARFVAANAGLTSSPILYIYLGDGQYWNCSTKTQTTWSPMGSSRYRQL